MEPQVSKVIKTPFVVTDFKSDLSKILALTDVQRSYLQVSDSDVKRWESQAFFMSEETVKDTYPELYVRGEIKIGNFTLYLEKVKHSSSGSTSKVGNCYGYS